MALRNLRRGTRLGKSKRMEIRISKDKKVKLMTEGERKGLIKKKINRSLMKQKIIITERISKYHK